MTLNDLLLAVALFQAKHFVADFLLQPSYVWRNKGTYGHPGGLIHAAVHGILSLPALWVLGFGPLLLLAVAAGEAVVHYHVDWGKERLNRSLGLKSDRAAYWYLFGLDQAMHQFTYVAILGLSVLVLA